MPDKQNLQILARLKGAAWLRFSKNSKVAPRLIDSLEGSLQNTTAILTVMVISGVLLFFSGWASKYINLTISTVMSRVVGILLAAIAIQTILNGLSHYGLIKI